VDYAADFTLYASGSRDDAMASLDKVPQDNPLAEAIRQALITALADAASEGATATEMLRYEITAAGTAQPGGVLILTVGCSGRYMSRDGGPAITITDEPA
jgi:hypothetical protein